MRPGRLTSPRPRAAVVLLGLALVGALSPAVAAAQEAPAPPPPAATAPAEAAAPQAGPTVYPRSSTAGRSHLRAHLALAAGAALSAGSFVLSAAADRAYERYKADTDPVQIERDYDAARRDDRWSAGLLLAGTGALALGVYWRFVHRSAGSPAAGLGLAPSVTPRHAGLALCAPLP